MHLKKVTLLPEKFPCKEYYPFNLNLFQKTGDIQFCSPVTFFIGENGTGKSTLIEAIALKCGIHIWCDPIKTRLEINPYEEELYRYLTVEWIDGAVPGSFFGSDIFREFAQYLDEWAAADPRILKYFGGKSLITQSHGQSLMSLFRVRYQIKGLYLMDEPETALSPKSQIELLKVIKDMGQAGQAQFIIATHSPILLACPGADIYSFDDTTLKMVDYEDTDYYVIYKDFMENRENYLEKI
ncbi:AAA family ATPase [Thermodesulfobacteriota bacterium]